MSLKLAQPGSTGSSAIPSLPGGNRTFSNPGSTLQQCNTRQLTQFALLCSSFTTSGFTKPRKSRAGRPLGCVASGALTTPVEYCDTARFHRASTGAFTPSPISDAHRCEIGGTRSQRLRAWPRANAYLCGLSAPRFALYPRRKPRCRPGDRRSRNNRVRPSVGGYCKVSYLGLHRCFHFGCRRNTQRTAGDNPLGLY